VCARHPDASLGHPFPQRLFRDLHAGQGDSTVSRLYTQIVSSGRIHSQVASALLAVILGSSLFTGCTPASMDLGPAGTGGDATGGHAPLPCKNANGGGGGPSIDVGTSGGAGRTLAGSSSATGNLGGAGGTEPHTAPIVRARSMPRSTAHLRSANQRISWCLPWTREAERMSLRPRSHGLPSMNVVTRMVARSRTRRTCQGPLLHAAKKGS